MRLCSREFVSVCVINLSVFVCGGGGPEAGPNGGVRSLIGRAVDILGFQHIPLA